MQIPKEERRRRNAEGQRRRRAENPEKHKTYNREWARKYRAKGNAWSIAAKERYTRKKYGISLEEKRALLDSQDGKCAICKVAEPGRRGDWIVDHCHDTRQIRGILCHHCNVMLGYAKDNAGTLRIAADYLEGNS
jgi:Recombination endonuclease VII